MRNKNNYHVICVLSKYWVFLLWLIFIPVVLSYDRLSRIIYNIPNIKDWTVVFESFVGTAFVFLIEALMVFFLLERCRKNNNWYFFTLFLVLFDLVLTLSFHGPATMFGHTIWLLSLFAGIILEYVILKYYSYRR